MVGKRTFSSSPKATTSMGRAVRAPRPASFDRDDPEHHAEIAVVAAGIHHAVDMGADQHGGASGFVALEAADHRAERVDMSAQAGTLHHGQGWLAAARWASDR